MASWLPELIRLEDYDNDWPRYLDAVYAVFRRDFVDTRCEFAGIRLGLKRNPLQEGREATFWHMVTTGDIEEERAPDLKRCERIAWPRRVIENYDSRDVLAWKNKRKRDDRILLYLREERYLVVLNVRNGYILPWTAYTVDRHHRDKKLLREYEAYQKAGASRLI